jgi:hypothetical protein
MNNINKIHEVPKDLLNQHLKNIEIGKEKWKNKKVVVCGLARNCADKIDRNLHLIKRLSKYFKNCKTVMFENNSTDDTKNIINKYIDDENIKNIGIDDSESDEDGISIDRIKRLAKYRTYLQEYVRSHYSDFDYVIVIDFDITGWSIDGILTSLSYEDFDVMGSVSLFYSPNAGSKDGWIHYDRWAFKFHTWYEEWATNDIDQNELEWFWYWKPPIGATPIKCLSVFGGLAIYKMSAYLSGKYDYKHPVEIGGSLTVEHAEFHHSMLKHGYNKVYLNPSQRSIIA